jgi:hypothetical protein
MPDQLHQETERERRFAMKKRLLFTSVGLVLVVAVALAVWAQGRGNKDNSGAAAESAGVKTVGVDAVAKDPKRHAGRIAVEGVVARVMAERGAIVLIDTTEFAACGTTTCAEYSVPVRVPKGEFQGELPKVKETVVAIGDLQPLEKGYRFTVHEVRRGGKAILSRTKAPSAQAVQAEDYLPATLLSNKDVLGLTADQVTRLNAIHAALSETRQTLQEKITHCQAELVELLEQKPVDQAKVDHEKGEIREFNAKLAEAQRKVEDAARAVLTPEQTKRL